MRFVRANMTEPQKSTGDWSIPWRGGRPRDFAEIGFAMRAGSEWEIALGNLLHDFVCLKDRRRLEAEPPSWMMREDRVLLAGISEFFARRFGLPRPDWVEKPEFFLQGDEWEYLYCCKPHGTSQVTLVLRLWMVVDRLRYKGVRPC